MEEEFVFATGQGYLEGLIRSRSSLNDAPKLLKKLDEVISLEIELALMGAEKAKSEAIKYNKATLTSIK